MVKQDSLAEAASLLEDIRRAREDSLRIAEYSASLSLSLDGKVREAELKKFYDTHHEEHEKLHLIIRLQTRREELTHFWSVFMQWWTTIRRQKFMRPHEEHEIDHQNQIRDAVQAQFLRNQQRWSDTLRRWQDEVVALQKQLQAEIGYAQDDLVQMRERCLDSRRKTADQLKRDVDLKRWWKHWLRCVDDKQRSTRREGVAKYYLELSIEQNNKRWLGSYLTAWHVVSAQSESKRIVVNEKTLETMGHCIMIFLGNNAERMVKLAMVAWQDEASLGRQAGEFADKLRLVDKATNLQEDATANFPARHLCRKMALVFLHQVDIQVYVDAWRELRTVNAEEKQEQGLQNRMMWLRQCAIRQDVVLQWCYGTVFQMISATLFSLYFGQWSYFTSLAQCTRRKETTKDCEELTEANKSWTARNRELDVFQKIDDMMKVLERKATARMRTAVQKLQKHHPPVRAGANSMRAQVQKELATARGHLAMVVAEKKGLSDKLLANYHDTMSKSSTVKKNMRMWAKHEVEDMLCFVIHTWKANVMVVHSLRMHTDHHSQAGDMQELVMKREVDLTTAQKHATLNIMHRQLLQINKMEAFHAWKLTVMILKQEWHLEHVNAMWESKKMNKKQELGKLLTRFMEDSVGKMKAATMMKAESDNYDVLRLAFFDWKNRYKQVGSDAARMTMMYGVMSAARMFDGRWLVPTCFGCWRNANQRTMVENEREALAEQTWLDVLLAQKCAANVQAVCSVWELCYPVLELRSVFRLWARLHDEYCVDRVAYTVQDQWKNRERATVARLQHMSHRCKLLSGFAVSKVNIDYTYKRMFMSFKAWSQVWMESALHKELVAREDSSLEALEAQRQFENVAYEQWMEKCMFMRYHLSVKRAARRCIYAWCSAASQQRAERLSSLGSVRAADVVNSMAKLSRSSALQLSFAGWQGVSNQARRRWLRRRCRKLEAALATRHGEGSSRGSGRRPPPLLSPGQRRAVPSEPATVDRHADRTGDRSGRRDEDFVGRLSRFNFSSFNSTL